MDGDGVRKPSCPALLPLHCLSHKALCFMAPSPVCCALPSPKGNCVHVPYHMQLEISTQFPHSVESWRASALLYKQFHDSVSHQRSFTPPHPPDVVNNAGS